MMMICIATVDSDDDDASDDDDLHCHTVDGDVDDA